MARGLGGNEGQWLIPRRKLGGALLCGKQRLRATRGALVAYALPRSRAACILKGMKAQQLLIALLALAASACGRRPASAEDFSAAAPPAETRYPRSVAEAAAMSLARMSVSEKTQLKAMKRDEVRALLHGFQMTARHDFGLSSGNPELLRSCGSETMVLEECLLVILDAAWLELNKTAQ
jgi:hypothetical protein